LLFAADPGAMESIAAMPQTALDWASATGAPSCNALAFCTRFAPMKKKASMPARRAKHGDAP
jgi:hypothetical protein